MSCECPFRPYSHFTTCKQPIMATQAESEQLQQEALKRFQSSPAVEVTIQCKYCTGSFAEDVMIQCGGHYECPECFNVSCGGPIPCPRCTELTMPSEMRPDGVCKDCDHAETILAQTRSASMECARCHDYERPLAGEYDINKPYICEGCRVEGSSSRCGCLPYGGYDHQASCQYATESPDVVPRPIECKPCNQTFADDVCPRCAGDMAAEAEPSPNALRYNSGKVDFTLVPLDALEAEAKVWMAGEAKYGRLNWQKLWADQTADVVLASLLRHAYAISRGEDVDPETGLPHAAHIRCNAGMLCYALAKGVKIR